MSEHEGTGESPPGGAGRAPRRFRRRKPHRGRRFALVFFAGLLVLVLVGAGGLFVYSRHIVGQVDRIPDVFAIPEAERPAGGAKDDLNILLAGSDIRAPGKTTGKTTGEDGGGDGGSGWAPGAARSDAIMIVHIDADRQSAYLVSIPRDSWITIPGIGKNKINAAFSLGGPSLYVKTIEKLTGIRIDHLAMIDFEGFRQLTDALGGVNIDVGTGGSCGEAVGPQKMDGAQALEYVRQRKCLQGGDFDRVKRQQNFLRSLMGTTLSRGTFTSPVKLNGVLNAVTKNLSVDQEWSTGDMRGLALSLRGLRSNDVRFMTAPLADPSTGREGAASVVYLDKAACDDLWEAYRTDDVGTYLATHQDGADVLGDDVN